MPVTPITPAQIDEVGNGACLTAPGSHPSDQTPTGSGGDAVSIPSRGPADADWLDQPIAGELVFEGMKFGKGVPLRVVVKAAQRWRRDALAAFDARVSNNRKEVMPDVTEPSREGGANGSNVTRPREEVRASGGATGLTVGEWITLRGRVIAASSISPDTWLTVRLDTGNVIAVDGPYNGVSRVSDEHPQGEDPQGAESRSDASAVGLQAETPGFAACRQAAQRASEKMAWAKPETTPSISSPPSPPKGQEENPCPMTVDEAREVLDGLDPLFGPPQMQVRQLKNLAANWVGGNRINILLRASRIELALSTIRASEEDR